MLFKGEVQKKNNQNTAVVKLRYIPVTEFQKCSQVLNISNKYSKEQHGTS